MFEFDFRKAVEEALIGFYVSTVDGHFLYANQHMLNIFGYGTLEELKKVYIPEDIYASKNDREIFLNYLKEKGRVDSIKIKIKKKSGDIRDIILSGRLFDDRRIEGWIIDITEHEQVKKEHHLFERVIKENSDAIFITDYFGKIIYTNDKFYKIIGNIRENATVRDILPVSSNTEINPKNIIKEIKINSQWIGELDVINEKNEIVPCAVKIFALYDDNGKIENFINVFRDITEKKELESQLKHAQKMELLGTMTGSVIHDMNNIITGVGYNVELLRMVREKAPEKSEKYLFNIEKSLKNASELLQKILRFTRKTKTTKEIIKISEAFDDIFSLVGSMLKKHNKIKFSKNIKCLDSKIFGNKSSFVQVLLNLIVNAIDAVYDNDITDGKISVTCELISLKGTSFVRIIVSDNGRGIDDDMKEKIFEPFFTTKTGERSDGKTGTGLGLSIVMREIKEMGGHVDFYSVKGKGTDFVILIPEYDGKKDEVIVDYKINSEKNNIKSKTIAILDDDNYFRESLVELLEFYGYKVISFETSDDFFKVLEKNINIDLLILDFVLEEGKSGEDILEYLKSKNFDIPVFLISGYIDSKILSLRKYRCVKNIIEKPVTGGEFTTKINEYFYSLN